MAALKPLLGHACWATGLLVAAWDRGIAAEIGAVDAPLGQIVVSTFNAGTPRCSREPYALYSCGAAEVAGEWYGTGLSFKVLVEKARVFFAGLRPDIVAFQEMFPSDACGDIPPAYHPGFVCEDWRAGDQSVVQQVLGPGYQIACNLGKADKCLAVRKSLGHWRGCLADLCLDHLAGAPVAGCGGGSRVGRGVVELLDGGVLTVVNIHGTSGMTPTDQDCRRRQFQQVFVDLGDGMPAANGTLNLIPGDLNTDPGRLVLDPSARFRNRHVGDGLAFHFLTDVGFNVEPTYAGLLNIDHVASDGFQGECRGMRVTDIVSFDHQPIVCTLTMPIQ
jgi:hypothetical protein